MKAAVFAMLAVIVLAGCASPDGQKSKVDTDILKESHVRAVCTLSVDTQEGMLVVLEECAFELKEGEKLSADSFECTGLKIGTGTFSYGDRSTSGAFTYYTPGGKSGTFGYEAEGQKGNSWTGSCTLRFNADEAGKYTVTVDARCYKDSSSWWNPTYEAKKTRCHEDVEADGKFRDSVTYKGGIF